MKPDTQIEHYNHRECVVRVHDLFTRDVSHDVTWTRTGPRPNDIRKDGVQAVDVDGNATHADLTPAQHDALEHATCDAAQDAIARWNDWEATGNE